MPNIPAGTQTIDLTPRAYALARLADRFMGTNLLQARAFGPGIPLQPTVAPLEQLQPRQFQYPVAVNTQTAPRREYPQLTPFEQLRSLAAMFDVAALCIATRIEELQGLSHHVQAKRKKEQAAENPTCDALDTFFAKPDQVNDYSAWLAMLLYDLFTLDALTIYPKPSQGGGLWGLEVIDGSTIKPLLDARGQTAAYQQILYGYPWSNYERPQPDANDDDFAEFSPNELLYRPRWPRSFTPYGFPPTEWIIIRVNTALRKQTFDLAHFTDSNIPAGVLSPPEGLMQPEQVAQFEEWWNAKLQGDQLARQRIIFLPWKGTLTPMVQLTEGGRYESTLDEWMLKITCAAFGVPPSEIGFTDDVNKATSQGQENITYRRGLGPLTVWLKQMFDRFIQVDLGCPQLEWTWDFGESEDDLKVAQVDHLYFQDGVVSNQELRTLRYPDLDGPAPGAPAAAAPVDVPTGEPTTPDGQPPDIARAAGSADAADPFAKKASDDEPPDWEERQKRERSAQKVFAQAYDAQAKRIKVMLRENVQAVDWSREQDALTQTVLPFYDETLSAAARAGLGQLPIGVDWNQVNEAVLTLAQERAQAFAADATQASQAQVSQVVADWIATGGEMDDLIDRVSRVWAGPRSDLAASTEVTRLYYDGNRAAYQTSGVVKAMIIRTSNDDRVCPVCGPLADTKRAFDEDGPPFHPGCRCWGVPDVMTPSELADST